MKVIMAVINLVLCLISLISIIAHLVMGQFGIAWLCVIPLIYGWGNWFAIGE